MGLADDSAYDLEVIPLDKAKIKMTKKLLDSYRKMKKEIPILTAELVEMQQGDNGFGNSVILNGRCYPPRPETVVGFDWDKYERRQKILDSKKAKCKAVERWIDAIEDGQTRCVFKMFYIEGLSWIKIADKIKATGDHREDYARKCIRDHYLKKCGIK